MKECILFQQTCQDYSCDKLKKYGTYSDQERQKKTKKKKVFEAEDDDKLQSQSLRASVEGRTKSPSYDINPIVFKRH